ncbi:MAG: 3',5'-cyclic-nucleotide phosphodiesterase [Deltaproteobacteria bacterium]|nr:3',5'-cyclic-nucleotide phosphodiesterase [Deltaproteobacteria bacterium]
MKIKILGCHGGSLLKFSPISLLINQDMVIDAGSLTTQLKLKEQHQLKHIFLTHSHMDHIKDLCFLADNLFLSGSHSSVTIYATDAILTDLQKNIFNGIIWPDVTQIPSREAPIFKFRSLKKPLSLDAVTIQGVAVNHSHSALGYILSTSTGSVVITGDTGPTDELWEITNRLQKLKAIFIECSFPGSLSDLAWKSRHLSTVTLLRELKKVKHPRTPIYVYAMKPVYVKQITSEIQALREKEIKFLKPNMVLQF